jgi:hypothetical protein
MTISMHMTMPPETTRVIEKRRGPLDSIAEVPTNLITLSPAFLDALREVAPKVRPRRMRHVVTLLAFAALAIVVGRQPLVRHEAAELVAALARPFERAPAVPAVAVSAAAPPVMRAAPSLAPAAVPIALRPDATGTSAPGTSAPGKPANLAPTRPISVDDLPLVTIPKANKNPRRTTTR